jgi:hypothetical protein
MFFESFARDSHSKISATNQRTKIFGKTLETLAGDHNRPLLGPRYGRLMMMMMMIWMGRDRTLATAALNSRLYESLKMRAITDVNRALVQWLDRRLSVERRSRRNCHFAHNKCHVHVYIWEWMHTHTYMHTHTHKHTRECIEKFPDWVDNEIYAYKNKHSLRSNKKGYGGKTH